MNCPGGIFHCEDGETCCPIGDDELACCPLVRAVCCLDRIHCCPEGTVCDIARGSCETAANKLTRWSIMREAGRAKPTDGKLKQRLKLQSRVKSNEGIEGPQKEEDLEEKIIFTPEKMGVAETSARLVTCQESACASYQTCCPTPSGKGHCCPLPQAFCCGDGRHCCPQGFTCSSNTNKCEKNHLFMPLVRRGP